MQCDLQVGWCNSFLWVHYCDKISQAVILEEERATVACGSAGFRPCLASLLHLGLQGGSAAWHTAEQAAHLVKRELRDRRGCTLKGTPGWK